MPANINTAFREFLSNSVNLDSNKSTSARTSRNWLVDRIHEFEDNYDDFPALYSQKDIFFGSFARKTKKRPLDDVDLMICMKAQGAYYTEISDYLEITVPDDTVNLKKLCFDDTNLLSSRKVINKFISKLNNIAQYENADIHLNQEAATLKLLSYEWNFDIVPCFFTQEDYYGKTYYIIPDGNGNWKKTDPRIDKERVSAVNQKHDGNILNVIRIIKFWNRRPTMPSIPSYLLENMILDYYEKNKFGKASEYIDWEIRDILSYLNKNIFYFVNDPKNLQGDLNSLTDEEKNKISERSFSDYQKAKQAIEYEGSDENHKRCISKWGEIFGPDFPKFE